jgi:P63C domain-containing protein
MEASMSDDDLKKVASRGGKARANILSPAERSEIAKRAARARWARDESAEDDGSADILNEITREPDRPDWALDHTLPYSMFQGTLDLGGILIECHVLSDHRRVLTQREVVRLISGGRESGNLQRYLQRNPVVEDDFLASKTVDFLVPGGNKANGYDAEVLIEICDLYLEARAQGRLKASQAKLAVQAEIVTRACAKVGIIALVDEATGFQKVRKDQALQLKLQAFIAEELQEWARMFPAEFWYELARLEGVQYSARHRPLRWGKYIMMFVYDAIDSDVGEELRKKNPNPRFLSNHHQWLRQHGREKVNDQVQRVIAVMKLCRDMKDFRAKFAHVFQKTPLQMSFDDVFMGR